MSARLLAGVRPDGQPLGWAEHLAVHGPLPDLGRRALRRHAEVLAGAGLRGRGGAGFPTARKLLAAERRGGLLVANGTEGEPASRKDEALLQLSPHLVLDGAQLAGALMSAAEVVLGLHSGSAARGAVEHALAVRADALPVRIVEVPHRYVSGEASALTRAALGGPALPQVHDEPLAVRGPQRKPVVVLNVESLAGLALLLRHGPDWYGSVGEPDEPGTLLLTVTAGDVRGQVLEVPLGLPLGQALSAVGVRARDLQAVLVGGFFGSWLPVDPALPLSHRGLAAAGGVLGAGMVLGLEHGECGLRSTAEVLHYLAGQSAGQCGPCVNGMPALSAAFGARVAGQPAPQLDRYLGLLPGRGLCHLPDGAVQLVSSALRVFADDLAHHDRTGGCGRDGRIVARWAA